MRLVQVRYNSIANALELHLFCSNPLKYSIWNSMKKLKCVTSQTEVS